MKRVRVFGGKVPAHTYRGGPTDESRSGLPGWFPKKKHGSLFPCRSRVSTPGVLDSGAPSPRPGTEGNVDTEGQASRVPGRESVEAEVGDALVPDALRPPRR